MSGMLRKYKKRGNQTSEKQILIESYGLCPLCLERLLDNNRGYIGKNLVIDELFTIICNDCNQKILNKNIDLEIIREFVNNRKSMLDIAFSKEV